MGEYTSESDEVPLQERQEGEPEYKGGKRRTGIRSRKTKGERGKGRQRGKYERPEELDKNKINSG